MKGYIYPAVHLQANYLRQLNQKGDPEAVIRQYEGGRVNSTEATLGEYVKALVKVDRLDSTALAHTLQVGLQQASGVCCSHQTTFNVWIEFFAVAEGSTGTTGWSQHKLCQSQRIWFICKPGRA